ncbi:hypothetical protein U1Q18_017895 [Sarracenia purpurea var. burkii]
MRRSNNGGSRCLLAAGAFFGQKVFLVCLQWSLVGLSVCSKVAGPLDAQSFRTDALLKASMVIVSASVMVRGFGRDVVARTSFSSFQQWSRTIGSMNFSACGFGYQQLRLFDYHEALLRIWISGVWGFHLYRVSLWKRVWIEDDRVFTRHMRRV